MNAGSRQAEFRLRQRLPSKSWSGLKKIFSGFFGQERAQSSLRLRGADPGRVPDEGPGGRREGAILAANLGGILKVHVPVLSLYDYTLPGNIGRSIQRSPRKPPDSSGGNPLFLILMSPQFRRRA